MKKAIFGSLITILLLSGCSTLPGKLSGRSVMIFNIENDRFGRGHYTHNYRFYYTDVDYFLLDPEENFYIRKKMPPGVYEFTKIRKIEKSNSRLSKPEEISITVELIPNEVTLVAEKLVILYDRYFQTQSKEIQVMSEEEQKEVLSAFREDKNAALWGL